MAISIEEVMETAKEVYHDLPVMQKAVVVQGYLESGGYKSQLAIKYNNLFGVKARQGEPSIHLKTIEHIDGKDISTMANFRVYFSVKEAVEAHRALMEKPRYALVLKAKTPPEAFQALSKSGYATDPKYAIKLTKIWFELIGKL
jgi:flagellum-specific peptidoglycan hydrolase FlgJ